MTVVVVGAGLGGLPVGRWAVADDGLTARTVLVSGDPFFVGGEELAGLGHGHGARLEPTSPLPSWVVPLSAPAQSAAAASRPQSQRRASRRTRAAANRACFCRRTHSDAARVLPPPLLSDATWGDPPEPSRRRCRMRHGVKVLFREPSGRTTASARAGDSTSIHRSVFGSQRVVTDECPSEQGQ